MPHTRRLPYAVPLSVVLLAAWLLTPTEGRTADKVVQLTSSETGCGYYSPQLSENGRWVAAISICSREVEDHQLVPDHQVVLIDRESGAVQVLTPPGTEAMSASVSGDGALVAFTCDGDLVPGQNPQHVEQVFLFDATRRRYTQVTHLKAADMRREIRLPRLSGNGDIIVFASNGDLAGKDNIDGNLELFVYEVKTGQLTQGTRTEDPAKHYAHVVSHDGQTIAFLGTHPPIGKRALTGLYVWDRKTGAVERLVQTPYPDAGAFAEVRMSAQGNRMIFSGKHDFVGENGDRNTELFLFDRDTRVARQLTHTRGCTNAFSALSGDGLRVVFVSDCRFGTINELLYTNLFLMRLDTDEVIPITDSGVSASVEPPTMDASERVVAVSFGAELKGMVNPNNLLQIALVNVPPIGPVAEVRPRLVTSAEVAAILASRHDPETFYLAGPQLGIMKSEDGGRSWRLSSFGMGSEHVVCLAEHPEKPRVVFAGTSNIGVYKTSDSGYIWVPANVGLADKRILGLAIDTAYPEVVYANTPSGVYRSDDEGGNWHHVTGPPPAPQHEAARVSWPERSVDSPTGRLVALTGPSGRLLQVSDAGLFVLPRETSEWVQLKTPHAPQWAAVGPNGTPWFIGTSQGMYYLDGPDAEWRPVSGLPAESIPAMMGGPGDTAYIAARGLFYGSKDGGRTWSRLASLEGMSRLMLARSPSDVIVSGLDNGGLEISRDGGAHWAPITIPSPSPKGLESALFRPAQ